jgi:DNA-binding CsgD family transcriptional regulator
MTSAAVRHRVDELVRCCYAGFDTVTLRQQVLGRLRRLVPIEAAFFATVDPATLLFTSAVAEDPLHTATALFLENEFGYDDVNKFTVLADADDPVNSLDRATKGDRRSSARYAEIMALLDLGDELRAALVSKGRCWGVMCLHRQDAPSGFTVEEVTLVRRLAPHIGEGLRRALLVHTETGPSATARAPGVILLNEDLSISSMNPQAQGWLAELGVDAVYDGAALPVPVVAAARAALVSGPNVASSSSVRLRTARGDWVALYASSMNGPNGPQTTLVLESARPVQVASLLLDAHGLTPAQARVAELVLRGRSTKQIVNELRISGHTVQEHLGVVFDRFGVGSRRELVAALLRGAT